MEWASTPPYGTPESWQDLTDYGTMVVEEQASKDSHSPPPNLLVRSILCSVLMPGWANGNRQKRWWISSWHQQISVHDWRLEDLSSYVWWAAYQSLRSNWSFPFVMNSKWTCWILNVEYELTMPVLPPLSEMYLVDYAQKMNSRLMTSSWRCLCSWAIWRRNIWGGAASF